MDHVVEELGRHQINTKIGEWLSGVENAKRERELERAHLELN